jgi:Cdc6-like AAA superfamily ATPase
MRHFVPSPTKSSGRTSAKRVEEPTVFVLFIDEIDKLPRSSVRKLYEIAKAPASRLVVVGIANHVRFRDEIDLEKEDLPELIVFPPLPKSSLKEIIASRTFGLIGDRAADMLVMKVGLKCSDVRLLLDLAAGSIDVAMRRPENAERAFEVGDFAVAEHPDVAKHFQAVGLGSILIAMALFSILIQVLL